MTEEKKQFMKYMIWINLAVGIQNLYYYVHNDSLFNLTIGVGKLNAFLTIAFNFNSQSLVLNKLIEINIEI